MSFNKRIFSLDLILDRKNEPFSSFDSWITKIDCPFYEDDFSNSYICVYNDLDDRRRVLLYEILDNDIDMVKDVLKAIKTVNNPSNKDSHKKKIKKYLTLLENKWSDKIEKYKELWKQ
jgi:hypothetical protein